jgi:hypothetical protein
MSAIDDSNIGGAVSDEPGSLAREKTAAFLARQNEPPAPAPTPAETQPHAEPVAPVYTDPEPVDYYADEDEAGYYGGEFEPEPSTWTGPTQEEWEDFQRDYRQVNELLQALTTPPEWDPLSDSAGEDLLERVGHAVDQRVAQSFQEAEAMYAQRAAWERHVAEQTELGLREAEANERVQEAVGIRDEILNEFQAELGDFDREAAYEWASLNLPVFQRIHGKKAGLEVARAALREGAKLARPFAVEGVVTDRYRAKERILGFHSRETRLHEIATAPKPTGVRQDGTTVDPAHLARSLTERMLARAELQMDPRR